MKNWVVILSIALGGSLWLAMIGGIIFWSLRRFKRKYAEWLAFGLAQQMLPVPRRWTYADFNAPRGEFMVHLRAEATQVGRSSDPNHLQIALTLALPNLPEKIAVYHENVMSKLGKLFHTQDIEIGEPAFDAEFKVKGKSPDAVRVYLLDRGRAQELRAQVRGPIAETILDEKGLLLRCSAHLDRPAEMEAVTARIELLAALAAALR